MNEDGLSKALHLLGEFLADGSRAPVWLVVGGGSALLAQRLSNRPTKDVDVMALREWEGNVISAYPLPRSPRNSSSTQIGLTEQPPYMASTSRSFPPASGKTSTPAITANS
jgi:hypothetical protein